MRSAARGDDKVLLLFSRILGKRQGSKLEDEAILCECSHWRNFRWARHAGAIARVSATLTNTRIAFSRRLRAWTGA
eukprot:4190738-Pyramimonas_sp.AAC.1